MTECIAVFLIYCVSDLLIVKYYRCINLQKKLPAALISAAIVGVTLLSIVIIVDSPWLIAAAMVGAFIGTIWGMRGK